MDQEAANNQDQKALFKLSFLTIVILILLSLFFTSCSYECDKIQYTHYDEVQLSMDSLRDAVSLEPARAIGTPGGLYYKDGFVYVNERGEGIHIIDNTNPNSPSPVAFISIPGNYGLAARLDYLYADSYVDLLIFDISDPYNIKEIGREEHAFEYISDASVHYDSYTQSLFTYNQRIETTTECDFDPEDSGNGGWFDGDTGGFAEDVAFGGSGGNKSGGSSNTGEAGSMARFVVSGDVLYTVDFSALNVFDVSEASDPEKEGRVDIGWGIETIFPHDNHLFIGAQDGMYIYNVQDPVNPVHVSVYSHANACDPVIVKGDYAYVTLRDGSGCNTFSNQLDIVNISDLAHPQLAKTYQMLNPHGLGIDGSCLFICEGEHGLKSYEIDALDPTKITEQSFHKDVDAFDVITLPNVLMMVGKDGFYQYETHCGSDLLYLSKIDFNL